jgi:hypothetical protein
MAESLKGPDKGSTEGKSEGDLFMGIQSGRITGKQRRQSSDGGIPLSGEEG